jgi:hypothetical protein
MKTQEELNKLQGCGFTCYDCDKFPCKENQTFTNVLCEQFNEIECEYFECPYTNPVCHIYCK